MLGVSQHMDLKLFGGEIIFYLNTVPKRIRTDGQTDGRTDGRYAIS